MSRSSSARRRWCAAWSSARTSPASPMSASRTFRTRRRTRHPVGRRGAFALTACRRASYMIDRPQRHAVARRRRAGRGRRQDVDGVVVRVRGAASSHRPRRAAARSARSLRPRSAARLWAARSAARARRRCRQPDGSFTLATVTPGKGTIAARCANGDQGASRSTSRRVAPRSWSRSPGASIAGKVTDGGGKPVPGVSVMASTQASSEHASSSTA